LYKRLKRIEPHPNPLFHKKADQAGEGDWKIEAKMDFTPTLSSAKKRNRLERELEDYSEDDLTPALSFWRGGLEDVSEE
jgi:hypothetical protein